MSETPNQEHKFDTLSLLEGLTEADSSHYNLEEILREFGGEEVREEKKSRKEQEMVEQIQQAITHEIEMSPEEAAPVISIENMLPTKDGGEAAAEEPAEEKKEEEPLSEADALLRKHGLRLVRREQKLPEEEPPEKAEKESLSEPSAAEPAAISIKIKDVVSRKKESTEEEEEEEVLDLPKEKIKVLPSAEALYHQANRSKKRGKGLIFLSFLITCVSLYWTLAFTRGWGTKAVFTDGQKASFVLAGLMVLSAFLSFETMARGFRELFSLQLRFSGAYTLLLLLTLYSAVTYKEGGYLAPCAVVSLISLFALWGDTLHHSGIRRSLRPLMKEEIHPSSATVLENAAEGCRTAARGIYSEEEHVRSLLSENHMQKQMDSYAAIALILSAAGAVIIKAKLNCQVLYVWNILLAALIPVAGFIGYERPFAALARVLMKKDSALSGWEGARVLSNADSVLMTDSDLFPKNQVKLSGVKLYGDFTMGRAASYVAAATEVSGCGIAPIFAELRENNNGRILDVYQFRFYEGGGIGAEITGDVVLVGSRRFMKLMGIPMEANPEIQNAVYMSVNGKPAAVFVLHYKVASRVRRAMSRLIKETGVKLLVASRDFMITPKFLEEIFKIQMDDVLFPSASERDSLAALDCRTEGSQGAILPDDSFDSLSDIMLFAKKLGSLTRLAAALSMVFSVLVAGILFALFLKKTVVTSVMLFLLSLLAAFPVLLVTASPFESAEGDTKKQPAASEKKPSGKMEKPASDEKSVSSSRKAKEKPAAMQGTDAGKKTAAKHSPDVKGKTAPKQSPEAKGKKPPIRKK